MSVEAIAAAAVRRAIAARLERVRAALPGAAVSATDDGSAARRLQALRSIGSAPR